LALVGLLLVADDDDLEGEDWEDGLVVDGVELTDSPLANVWCAFPLVVDEEEKARALVSVVSLALFISRVFTKLVQSDAARLRSSLKSLSR